jgi:carbon storage regulator
MLVLSRKLGEKIIVPAHEIIVKVLEIRGNKVRLGIAAPSDTEVFRHEVWERVSPFREDEAVSVGIAVDPEAARAGGPGSHEQARAHVRTDR